MPRPTSTPLNWPLTGRGEEFDAIVGVLTGVSSSPHVVVAGAAGVGKSRLVREASAQLATAGWAVVRVVGTHAGASIPLGAFAPVLASGLASTADPLALLASARESVLAAGHGESVLLAVDDADRLDPASATLVAQLVASGDVRLAATVRTGAPSPDAITNLWKDGDAVRLELQSLSAREVAELLTAVLDGPVAEHTVSWAFQSSEGNPLYLRELIDAAVDEGLLSVHDGLWQLRGTPRPTPRLADLVATRLTGLDDEQQHALELVALGEPLPLGVLEQLCSPSSVEALERRGLTRVIDSPRPGGWTVELGHPLYGEVVRATIGAAAARRARRALADALRAAPSGRADDELRIASWLLDAGEPADPALWRRASTLAALAMDHPLAARLADAALAVNRDLESSVAAAAAHRAMGDSVRAEDLLSSVEQLAADAVADRPEVAREYLFARVAALHWGLDRLDDALAVLRRAEGWGDEPGWQHWVRGQRVTQLSTAGRLREAVAEGNALLAEPDLAPATRFPLAVGHAFAWHQTGHVSEALRLLDTCISADGPSARVDFPPEAMWALVAINGGVRWSEAGDRLVALRDVALAERNVAAAGYAELFLGQLALAQGAVNDALARLSEAEAHLTVRDSRGLLGAVRTLKIIALAMSGATDGALTQFRAMRAGRSSNPWAGRAEAVRADLWAAVALGRVSEGITGAFDAVPTLAEAPLHQAYLLHDLLRVGAPAQRVLPLLVAAADQVDSPLVDQCLRHADALAREDPAALDAVSEAFADIGANLLAAEAAHAAATAYRRAALPDSAVRSGQRSSRLLTRCAGAATPALRTAATEAGLTSREQEIVVLAARGMSNLDIAAQLVLSVRTVESHLYRASAKLGVANRNDLASALGLSGS